MASPPAAHTPFEFGAATAAGEGAAQESQVLARAPAPYPFGALSPYASTPAVLATPGPATPFPPDVSTAARPGPAGTGAGAAEAETGCSCSIGPDQVPIASPFPLTATAPASCSDKGGVPGPAFRFPRIPLSAGVSQPLRSQANEVHPKEVSAPLRKKSARKRPRGSSAGAGLAFPAFPPSPPLEADL
eukprot:tig00000430_g626.t1